MRFVIPAHHTQGASRHHGGAAIGDMGTIYRLKRRQILSRFPTQNRAIKRGSNRPSALPTAAATDSGLRLVNKLHRCPVQFVVLWELVTALNYIRF